MQVHIRKVEVVCPVLGKGTDANTVNIKYCLPWVFNSSNHYTLYVLYFYHFDCKDRHFF